MSLSLALVGCGGMGLRHAYGYGELKKRFSGVRLEAVCDLHASSAGHVASEVELLTGERPRVYTSFDEMLAEEPGLDALDIATDPRTHHTLAVSAMEAGLHVLVEKPMAVTVKACRLMAEASRKHRRVLSVAENYRRDPMNRLAKALLESGVIGTPHFMLKIGVGGGSSLACSVGWHTRKEYGGGVLVEQGAHEADLVLYFMGEVRSVSAEAALFTPDRTFVASKERLSQYSEYRVESVSSNSPTFTLGQEDTAFALLRFQSGAIGQYTLTNASHGFGISLETVHGSLGTLMLPASRTGKGPEVRLEAGGRRYEGATLLDLVPEWELDDVTAGIWDGQRRMSSYDLSFEEADRKLIAVELQEFIYAIENGTKPEIDEVVGAMVVALAYAPLESNCAGRPVQMSEVISGAESGYQRSIDEGLGL
ncbi:MAG: Gfo/Idh/MocA family oxidoreductase [Chloroflexi bacterium]|nr:Gfo/Idh/MocA family oxidoreductase [Chloroflexota bacterium]